MVKMVIYSHSKLSTFEQCPLKFKYRYIDRIPPEIEQTIEGFLGKQVHNILEWVYNEVMKGKTFELDEIVKKYAENWNKEFNNNIKVVKENLIAEDYFNKGIKFLINYYLKHAPFKDNTIATEQKIMVNLDPDGNYILQGYIDRLVHNKDTNIFEIHDYKTGTLKSQEDLDKDRQLALYSIGIRNLFDNVKDVHLVWHFLDYNEQKISKRTEEQLNELRKKIIDLIDKIESTTDFSPNPSILCEWCEFQNYCPYYKKEKIISSFSQESQETLYNDSD